MRRLMASMGVTSMLIAGSPSPAKADFFGGDVVVLTNLLANAVQQLVQLKQLLSSTRDTLSLMKQINEGIRQGLALRETLSIKNPAGVLSGLEDIEAAMTKVEAIYGLVPRTSEAPRQKIADQAVAEAITLQNDALRYANEVDPKAQEIKSHARVVNPQGAQRLTAQSLGVLIEVTNQVLRTNAAMLKLQGQQLALQNRNSKLSSEQFVRQYGELSQSFSNFKPSYDLARIGH